MKPSALILSQDPVAAALVSAAAELAGVTPMFLEAGTTARQTLRRLRPTVVVADCNLDFNGDAFVGPAMMTGARVAIFCSGADAPAAARARQLADRYDVAFFLLPDDVDALQAYLHEVASSTRRAASP